MVIWNYLPITSRALSLSGLSLNSAVFKRNGNTFIASVSLRMTFLWQKKPTLFHIFYNISKLSIRWQWEHDPLTFHLSTGLSTKFVGKHLFYMLEWTLASHKFHLLKNNLCCICVETSRPKSTRKKLIISCSLFLLMTVFNFTPGPQIFFVCWQGHLKWSHITPLSINVFQKSCNKMLIFLNQAVLSTFKMKAP